MKFSGSSTLGVRAVGDEYTAPPARTEQGHILLYRIPGDRWQVARQSDLDGGLGSKAHHRIEIVSVLPAEQIESFREGIARRLEVLADEAEHNAQEPLEAVTAFREAAQIARDFSLTDSPKEDK